MNTGLCQRAGAQLLPRASRVCGHRRSPCLRLGPLYNEDQSTHLCVCVRVHTRVSRWAAGAAVRSTVSAAACVVVTLDRTPRYPARLHVRACVHACIRTSVYARARILLRPREPLIAVNARAAREKTRHPQLPALPLSLFLFLFLSLSFLFLSPRTREHAPRLYTPTEIICDL